MERLGSSAPATLPWGAGRATSRLEKAPECGSSSDSGVAAPNLGARAALHLRARVPILWAERSGQLRKRLSDPLKLQIVGCSWQSGGER